MSSLRRSCTALLGWPLLTVFAPALSPISPKSLKKAQQIACFTLTSLLTNCIRPSRRSGRLPGISRAPSAARAARGKGDCWRRWVPKAGSWSTGKNRALVEQTWSTSTRRWPEPARKTAKLYACGLCRITLHSWIVCNPFPFQCVAETGGAGVAPSTPGLRVSGSRPVAGSDRCGFLRRRPSGAGGPSANLCVLADGHLDGRDRAVVAMVEAGSLASASLRCELEEAKTGCPELP